MSTYTPPDLDGIFVPQFIGGYVPPPLDQPIEVDVTFIDWSLPIYFLTGVEVGSDLQRTFREFLVERLGMSERASTSLLMTSTLSEQCAFLGRLAISLRVTLSEDVELSEVLPSGVAIPRRLEEALGLFATQQATAEYQAVLEETMSLLDRLMGGAFSTLVEGLDVAAALEAVVTYATLVQEGLEVNDGLSLRLVAFLRDGILADEELDARRIWNAVMQAGLAFISSVPIDEAEYTGIVMNTTNQATSTYPQFGARSIVEHNGSLYLATADGIYRMDEAADDIERVRVRLKTGQMMFTTAMDKSVPYGYLYMAAKGPVLRVIISKAGQVQAERTYRVMPTRTQFDRSARGQWWQFELEAEEAENVDLEGAEVIPVVMRNRR